MELNEKSVTDSWKTPKYLEIKKETSQMVKEEITGASKTEWNENETHYIQMCGIRES